MINRLSISNYILIESLEIQLDAGLNMVTGETGAGKSILMGAMGLLLGERADLKAMTKPDEKCVIEGWFSVSNPHLEAMFLEAAVDYEPETIIRREILPGGKSRAFVNDSPVTLDVLKKIGSQLIDIHGQQDTQLLATPEKQVQTFDTLAEVLAEKTAFQLAFREWKKTEKELADWKATLQKENAELSYKQFIFNELEQAKLKAGEQEDLEKQLDLLKHAEDIKSKLVQTLTLLEGDTDLISNIRQAASTLEKLAPYSTNLEELAKRLQSVWVELKDILGEIGEVEATVIHDSAKINHLDERLSILYALQKKHRKASVEELIAWQNELSGQLEGFSNLETDIAKKEQELALRLTEMNKLGASLREKRKAKSATVSKNLLQAIAEMGMEKARFEVSMQEQLPAESGLDKISFMFSANPGLPLSELKNSASGGEFSRLMLAFKCLLAEKQEMPTLLFDEIDTGISGEIAARVGKIMKKLSTRHQVISITHSPQMASQSDAHWFVYKIQGKTTTTTGIRRLSETEKLEEIAKMISGSTVSPAALEAAKHLIYEN